MVAGFLLSVVCEDRKGLGSSLGVSECLSEQVLLMTLTLAEVLAVLLGLGTAEWQLSWLTLLAPVEPLLRRRGKQAQH